MMDNLLIENFRSFRRFEMPKLGRVNLVVGMNNSGKTTILEAIHLLAGGAEIGPMSSILFRRGEEYYEDRPNTRTVRYLDVRTLFHGFAGGPGSTYSITGLAQGAKTSLNVEIVKTSLGEQGNLFEESPES